ncbi:MAG: Gfo/Idh/MocA family oxidoreductase [Candidatus Sumerlaeia bacterium]|nr:Gfo/Idh/MocA family oxidoreductase [Candidatus Sumerlaeia bacterium]
MTRLIRRRFLQQSSLAAAVSLAGTPRTWAGANERIRVGVIGLGIRGSQHIEAVSRFKDVEVAAVCDPDENRLSAGAAKVESRSGKKPSAFPDLRKILDDKTIDAVMIAACNHWHALATIWACQAGKHVYVEKPAMHNLFEGRKMIEAARKYNRIVAGGTQRRSSAMYRRAMQALHDGIIGDIYLGRWLINGARGSIGFKQPSDPPAWLHWDLWVGPARMEPYHANLVHYNWHWFWNFGNGEMGNNGPHSFDILRWGMRKRLPVKIYSAGGRFGYKDQAETPNTQIASLEFDDGTLMTCEIRGHHNNDEGGIWFYGSKGSATIGDGQFNVFLGRSKEPLPEPIAKESGGDHFRNFFDAIRAGDPKRLNADVEETVLSTALCELANISYRVGHSVVFDPKTETFPGDDAANRLLRREPREPYVVPEKV